MENKRFWIIVAVLGVAFLGFIFWNNNKSDSQGGSSSTEKDTPSQNYYGKLDSPVTITEFVDFQCEACYAYYPAVKEVKEKYKDRVRFQVRHFALGGHHQFAIQAARNAQAAANQDKFWEMHDKIFEGQKIWERTQDPQSYFNQYAQEIGLDMTKFEADYKSSAINDIINTDVRDVKKLGGTGTPTFVINNKLVDRPTPTVEGLSAMIDQALKDAGKQ